jgi:hypothetical protein
MEMCCVLLEAYPTEETFSTIDKVVALHWNLTWAWGLRQWCLILSLLCCFLSLARWMDPYTGGETTGSGMQSSFSSATNETSASYAFRLVTLTQHEYLFHNHWHLFVHNVGYPHTILHILVKCSHYDKEHLTLHLHGMLCNILGDDHHSMFNILALVSSMRIIKYIPLAEFYVFIVILMTISLYSYCYFTTSSAVPYTVWQSITF